MFLYSRDSRSIFLYGSIRDTDWMNRAESLIHDLNGIISCTHNSATYRRERSEKYKIPQTFDPTLVDAAGAGARWLKLGPGWQLDRFDSQFDEMLLQAQVKFGDRIYIVLALAQR